MGKQSVKIQMVIIDIDSMIPENHLLIHQASPADH